MLKPNFAAGFSPYGFRFSDQLRAGYTPHGFRLRPTVPASCGSLGFFRLRRQFLRSLLLRVFRLLKRRVGCTPQGLCLRQRFALGLPLRALRLSSSASAKTFCGVYSLGFFVFCGSFVVYSLGFWSSAQGFCSVYSLGYFVF